MSEKLIYIPDRRYMERALELAETAAQAGEIPVGAVIVHKPTGEIIGEGYNKRESVKSPLAHAELMAIEAASKRLGGWRIVDSVMYVTLEPCPMCSGGIIHGRLDHIVFGAYDSKSGSVCSVQRMFELPYNHKPSVTAGFMEKECSELLKSFFRELREKRKTDNWKLRRKMQNK